MKKILFLVLFVFAQCIVFAQEVKDTNLVANAEIKTSVNERRTFPFSDRFLATPTILNRNEIFSFSRTAPMFQDFKQPVFNKIADIPVQALENSYRFFQRNENAWIGTEHQSNHYFGLGGLTLVGANYNQLIGNSVLISGGVYASKFNVYNNFYNSAGFNGNVKFRVSDRISVNMFGQYSVTDNKRPIFMVNSMYPQTNYGGSIEFKVTDSWGIVTGADREFDVMQRKWVTRPFILPVFYGR